jgi:hypothetical protein
MCRHLTLGLGGEEKKKTRESRGSEKNKTKQNKTMRKNLANDTHDKEKKRKKIKWNFSSSS